MAVSLILLTIGIINIQCANTRSINQDVNFPRRNKTLKSIPNVAFHSVGPHCENKTVLETKKVCFNKKCMNFTFPKIVEDCHSLGWDVKNNTESIQQQM